MILITNGGQATYRHADIYHWKYIRYINKMTKLLG